MKKDIHPSEYRRVIFRDKSAGFMFLTRSTAAATETAKWEDGQEYPVVDMQISSASHPFFTGEEKIIDTEGRVDRFKAKFAKAEERKAALVSKAKKQAKAAARKDDKAE
jgi:large subunit ribosomal protein L31